MPRPQRGRGKGAQRGHKPSSSGSSKSGSSSGGKRKGGGVGGVACRGDGASALRAAAGSVQGKNFALHEDSQTLILEMMGELEHQRQQDEVRGTTVVIEEGGEGEEHEEEDYSSGDYSEEEEEDEEGMAQKRKSGSEMLLMEEDGDQEGIAFEGLTLNEKGVAEAVGYEYSSYFVRANLMGLADESGSDNSEEEDITKKSKSSKMVSSSAASSRKSKSAAGKTTVVSDGSDGEGGEAENGVKRKPMTKHDQKRLLNTLIQEERQVFVAEQKKAKEAAVTRLVEGGGGGDKGGGGAGGKFKKNIRVTICSSKGSQKLVVLDRKKDLEGLFAVARSKLNIKKPVRAFLLKTGEDLENTLLLEDGAVVCIADKKDKEGDVGSGGGGGGGRKKAAEEEEVEQQPAGPPSSCSTDADALSLEAVREAYRKRAADRLNRVVRLSDEDKATENARLIASFTERKVKPGYNEMMVQRIALPAYGMKDAILEAIESSQIVVIEGATGSGKTTQIPQFILDAWVAQGRGADCNIICTQPRRISAVGVAERVAAERLESVGQSVGYAIRLDQRRSAKTRLLFVTTGVLLRRLTSDAELQGVSHVLVDEVHERDLQTDFLLIVLKDLLVRRPTLKVVLMSATLEASLFSKYFGGCPCLHIPGRLHPVTHLYLDDAIDAVEGRMVGSGTASRGARGGGGAGGRGGRGGGGGRGRGSGRGGGRDRGRQSKGEEEGVDDGEEETGERDTDLEEVFGIDSRKLKALMSVPSDRTPLPYDLIVALTRHIIMESLSESTAKGEWKTGCQPNGQAWGPEGRGAVLIFLPGFAEIDRTIGMMKKDGLLGDANKARIFPLHSSMPTDAQRAVFKRMPIGVFKIVVATNIAETSITIDDVTHVIDSGRVKEMGYDPQTHMSSLREVWVSQASAAQRAGRAGRVQPGQCWRLYAPEFMKETMLEHTLPEIRRTSLEDLVLTALLLELGPPQEFLKKAVQPPSSRAIAAALRTLLEIEAIVQAPADGTILLKPLGYHLASLPVDVRLGKMLIVAAVFDALEPMLTIAAALSGKSPFAVPFGKQQEAWMAKQRFGGSKSDHLGLVEVFKAWMKVRNESWTTRREFCWENFLSLSALENMEAVRKQFRSSLQELGFASARDSKDEAVIDYTANECDTNLLKCILCCGLSPQVAKLVRPVRGKGAHFIIRDHGEVQIHPSSVNSKRIREAAPKGREVLALYHRKVRTSKVYLHDITFCSPLSLLLFGTDVRLSREYGGVNSKVTLVTVDGWISFKMREDSSVLLKVLKRKIDECLLKKIAEPESDHIRSLKPVTDTIRKLLTAELMGGGGAA